MNSKPPDTGTRRRGDTGQELEGERGRQIFDTGKPAKLPHAR